MVALSVLAAAAAVVAGGPPQEFAVRSTADDFVLHGQVDLPSGEAPKALVVFLPGSGNHPRDFEFTAKGAPRRYVFAELAQAMNARGLATLRYDERGSSCFGKTLPADGSRRCRDDQAAGTINWTTLHGDAQAVVDEAAKRPGGQCLILMGHSEGAAHAIRLIERKEVKAAGLIGIGAVLDTLAGTIYWQAVQVGADSIAMSDLNRDGRVTKAEFRANVVNTPAGRNGRDSEVEMHGVTWPAAGMRAKDIAALRVAAAKDFEAQREMILAAKPEDPLPGQEDDGRGYVRASFAWFRPFLEEWTPEAFRLRSFMGPMRFFYGDHDGNVEATRQMSSARLLLSNPDLRFTVIKGVGHTLGQDATFGPMRADGQAAVVAAAEEIARTCRQ